MQRKGEWDGRRKGERNGGSESASTSKELGVLYFGNLASPVAGQPFIAVEGRQEDRTISVGLTHPGRDLRR